MTAAPMPAARPISANSSSVEIPAWNGESTQLVKWMLQPILEDRPGTSRWIGVVPVLAQVVRGTS
jgi:hypothetical protein